MQGVLLLIGTALNRKRGSISGRMCLFLTAILLLGFLLIPTCYVYVCAFWPLGGFQSCTAVRKSGDIGRAQSGAISDLWLKFCFETNVVLLDWAPENLRREVFNILLCLNQTFDFFSLTSCVIAVF